MVKRKNNITSIDADKIKEYERNQRSLYIKTIGTGFIQNDPTGLTVAGRWKEHEAYPYAEHIMEKFSESELESLRTSGACLDFGCGNGRMLAQMENLFYHVDGCDMNPEFLEAARSYLDSHTKLISESRCSLYRTTGSSSKIDAPSSSYDLIFSTIALIHIIPWSIRMNILKDHYDLLNPGGRLCHQMIYKWSPRGLKFDWCSWRYQNFDACTGGRNIVILDDDIVNLTEDLEDLGFKNIELTFKDPPKPPGERFVFGKYRGCKWIYINATK